MTISLRITGKNADGEYWLHLDGSPQKAGLNLGDPAGMIASALLMAASGHTYIRADAPELVALVDALREVAVRPTLYTDGGELDWLIDDAKSALAAWEAMK